MIAFLGLLGGAWGRVAGFAAALGTALLAAMGAYAAVRREGAVSQQLDDLKQGEQDRAKADGAANGVAAMDGAAVDRELRSRFSRSP